MSVSVRIPTILRTYTGGQAEVQAEGATLADVIADLEKNHTGIAARVLDDQGKLRRFVNVYVNDDDVRFEQGLETATPDGAGVSIIPAVAGGGTYDWSLPSGTENAEWSSHFPLPREEGGGIFYGWGRDKLGSS